MEWRLEWILTHDGQEMPDGSINLFDLVAQAELEADMFTIPDGTLTSRSPFADAEFALDQIRDVLDTAKHDRGRGVGATVADGIWSTEDLDVVIANEHGYYTPIEVAHAQTVQAMASSSPEARDLLGITESGGGWGWDMIGHVTLDVLGMVPVVGNAADGINASWYAAQGEWLDAALSSMALIPGIGQAVTLARSSVTAALRHIPFNSLDEALLAVRRWLENAGILRATDEGLEVVSDSAGSGSSLRQSGAGGSFEDADAAYDLIRASVSDVDAIARNSEFSNAEIADIKHHLFEQEHLLDRYVDLGVPAEWSRFDSHPGIADAWNRLEAGTHLPEDIQLLHHELTELRFMQQTGNPSYIRAHEHAELTSPAPTFGDI